METKDLARSITSVRSFRVTHLVVDQSRQRQVIEEICKELPNVCVSVFTKALVVEAIDLSDLPALVVSTKNRDSVSVAKFESDQQRHGLYRVVTSIDVITHEEVVCVWRVSADPEQFTEVVLIHQHQRP